ncbi:TPA: YihA family ribosome biogenesis GTP-binding protein [Candidatus Galligastranaerophilus gallistercoris]|nr:YihA family ribosome biogenesis GTP-binding protein [Candidatus Galligastranaerophilus gallistercoris]
MKIKQARFITSSPSLKSAPTFNCCEFALLGRSNAGKSTFINSLVNNSKLAKTSNTPGKTRLINHFEIITDCGNFIFADLPGYGYAKVSKTMQQEWQKNLEEYLLKRENLKHCFLFIDSRHGLLDNDIKMIDWLIINKVPFINILAKADMAKQGEISKRIKEIEDFTKTMCIPYSSKKPFYREKVFDFLECNIN